MRQKFHHAAKAHLLVERGGDLLRAAGGHALDGRELFRLGFKHLQRLDAKSGDELFRRRGADAAHDAGSEVV